MNRLTLVDFRSESLRSYVSKDLRLPNLEKRVHCYPPFSGTMYLEQASLQRLSPECDKASDN